MHGHNVTLRVLKHKTSVLEKEHSAATSTHQGQRDSDPS